MMIVACDIDHTLSDAWWRDGMIGVKSWDEYHDAGADDFPLKETIELIRALSSHYSIVGLTARPEKWRSQTNRWLMDNYVPMHHLLMRPDDDHRSSPLVKMDLLTAHCPLSEVAFVLDDRADVASAFVEKQVTVLQVHARRRKE
jgi:hypothetical protein